MTQFRDDLGRFARKMNQRAKDAHNRICDLAYESITEGSAITGAPGQPVDTGFLKGSWQNLFLGPLSRLIATNVAYAPVIEENSRAAYVPSGVQRPKPPPGGSTTRHKSTVGGNHSVALTRAGWQRLVEEGTRQVVAGA